MIHVPDWKNGLPWYQQAFPNAEVKKIQAKNRKYLEFDGIDIELVNCDERAPSGVAGSVVYWGVDDFDHRLEYLISIGASLFRGPIEINGKLRICQVKDPFGNVFGIRENKLVAC
jgi:predicted enzyme related to lactoylglutathione lyase